MDSYIDHEIKVLIRNGEMIHLSAVVSDEVVYRNVWLAPGEHKKMNLYIGTIIREFPSAKEVEEEEGGVLADVSLSKGKIKKLSLKKDTRFLQSGTIPLRSRDTERCGWTKTSRFIRHTES